MSARLAGHSEGKHNEEPGAHNRTTETLRNVESAWIKDMNVMIENGNISGYKVNLAITFVLEEGEQLS